MEDDIEIGRHGEPGILANFLLELPGRPARIAEREHRVGRSVAARDCFQDVERRAQDLGSRIGDVERRGEQWIVTRLDRNRDALPMAETGFRSV